MRCISWIQTVVLLLAFAGCTSNAPRSSESDEVEQATSRKTVTNDATQRAKAHTELGRLYLDQALYEVALEEARIAIQSESGYAPAHNLMGLVYMALEKNELSEKAFRQALRLAPNDPEINNDFGWFLCQTGKARESLAHFRLVIGNPLYKMPVKPLTNAGLCALTLKEDKVAEDYLLRSLRIDRRNPVALYWLADIAYRDGRIAEAQQRIKELHVMMEPSAESAWLGLRIERKVGDREAEARYMGVLRRKYRESPEHQKMLRGEFD